MAMPTDPVPKPIMTYQRGVVLVLLAGVCWSSFGVGVRLIEVADVWQILFYRSLALTPFLIFVIAVRAGGDAVGAIYRAGWAGVVGGISLVFAFGGGISRDPEHHGCQRHVSVCRRALLRGHPGQGPVEGERSLRH